MKAIVKDEFLNHNRQCADFNVYALSKSRRRYRTDYLDSRDPNTHDKQKSTRRTHRIEYDRGQERILHRANRVFLDLDS